MRPAAPVRAAHRAHSQPSHPDPALSARRTPPWHARLMRVCTRLGRQAAEAEDLVQDAYVRWLEYRRAHPVRDDPALLARIVQNLAISEYRRQRNPLHAPERLEDLERTGPLPDHTPGAEEIVAACEQLMQVAYRLARVSARTCTIFLAHHSGYRHREIAAVLAVSESAVEKHIARARRILRLRGSTSQD